MDRLLAFSKHIDDPDFQPNFACPTLVDRWVAFLGQIHPHANPKALIEERQRRNLGYRLQLMEFECALLLLDFEVKKRSRGYSTLHETISRMKIHQFAVLAHSVLEGIASHIYRVNEVSHGRSVDPRDRVPVAKWRSVLADEMLNSDQKPEFPNNELLDNLEQITKWRDRVHLDRIELDDPLHFDEFTYKDSFIPTYQTFRAVLTALSSKWPESCLNEELA